VRRGIENEIAEWEKHDPLKRLGEWLIANRLASADDLQRMRQEVEQRIEETFKRVAAEMK
jgi:TPP-dependent pyruvate/acetoin dehydrogenase alpha subunit